MDKEFDIKKLQEEQKDNFYKRTKHGLMLNNEQKEILKKYNFDYDSYTSLESLLFDIESVLQEESYEDLESVSKTLSEIYYYYHMNK